MSTGRDCTKWFRYPFRKISVFIFWKDRKRAQKEERLKKDLEKASGDHKVFNYFAVQISKTFRIRMIRWQITTIQLQKTIMNLAIKSVRTRTSDSLKVQLHNFSFTDMLQKSKYRKVETQNPLKNQNQQNIATIICETNRHRPIVYKAQTT